MEENHGNGGRAGSPDVWTVQEAGFELVGIQLITPSRTNPRKHFDPAALAELTANVKAVGILQPLLVRKAQQGWIAGEDGRRWLCAVRWPEAVGSVCHVCGGRSGENGAPDYLPEDGASVGYELVAGERRYRAAKAAGLERVPVMVRELTDLQVLELQMIENLQRADLSALEEAEGFQSLIASGQYTAEALAEKLNKSRAHVFSRLRLLKLGGPIREALAAGKINHSIAGLIAQIPHPEKQKEALDDVGGGRRGEPVSYREAKDTIERRFMVSLKRAPFDCQEGGSPGSARARSVRSGA